MGYGKWRKILTILLIINMLFVIFSNFSKVFAKTEGETSSLIIYGKQYDLYYKYINNYYDYYILCAVQEYQGNVSGYNRIYLYASNNEIIYDEYSNNYSDGTYLESVTFKPSNNSSISYFVGDNSSSYNNRFNFDTTVANFNNCDFIPNASSGFHDFGAIGFQYNNMNNSPVFTNGTFNNNYNKSTCVILDANFDVKDKNNNIIFYSNNRRPPELATSLEDLQNLTFDGLSINSWGYSDINFYLLIYDMTLINNDYDYVLNPAREILINKNSSYYQSKLTSNPDTNCVYFVPISDIGLQFQKGGIYQIQFGIKKYYDEGRRRSRWWRTEEVEALRILHQQNL